MRDTLDTIETFRAEDASPTRLAAGYDGMRRTGSTRTVEHLRRVEEAKRIIDAARNRGWARDIANLQEAMTTSDFPYLMGDIIDRQLLARYREFPSSYRQYVHISQVRDFRSVRRVTVDGGEGRLQKIGTIPEESEYQFEALSDGTYTYAVAKYGKKFRFSWEDFIDDDLGGLGDSPDRLGRSARRTEEYFATDLFFDANGPDATFFSTGNKNRVTANPALSIAGLQTAMQTLAAQVDADGEPIAVDGMTLVIPPALEVTAQNILNATEIWLTTAGGATGQEVHVMNWMRSKLKLAVAPYIPVIATTNGNTSWLIVADPNQGRPAAEIGFLRGHTDPELFQKAANATRVGGGDVSPMDGDFETDSIEYKVRHVIGGILMDPKSAVGSNGSGS